MLLVYRPEGGEPINHNISIRGVIIDLWPVLLGGLMSSLATTCIHYSYTGGTSGLLDIHEWLSQYLGGRQGVPFINVAVSVAQPFLMWLPSSRLCSAFIRNILTHLVFMVCCLSANEISTLDST